MIGVVPGMFLRRAVSGLADDSSERFPIRQYISGSFFEIGLLVIPLAIPTILFFGGQDGLSYNSTAALVELILLYIFVNAALLFAAIRLHPRKEGLQFKEVFLVLALLELLPLPFILIATIAYPSIKLASIGIFGGMPALSSVLLFDATRSRTTLIRRIQDLSLLNEISQVIRYSNNLAIPITWTGCLLRSMIKLRNCWG
jgi:hypothetical protein